MFLISLLIFFISFVIIILAIILSKKSFYDREKNSPFECGFDPYRSSRIPFSLRFFLVTIIFLIFDVEIVLLFPVILIMEFSNILFWFITLFLFIFILLIGVYHEWNQGALNWSD